MSELNEETNVRSRNPLVGIIRKPLKVFGSFMRRTIKKCFGCGKRGFEGEVVIRDDINNVLSPHSVSTDNRKIEEDSERQVMQVPATISGTNSSASGSQAPSSESATTGSMESTNSSPQSADSPAQTELSSPTAAIQKTSYNGLVSPDEVASEARDEQYAIYSNQKHMEQTEADESRQGSNLVTDSDYSSGCSSNSVTPSTHITHSWNEKASSDNSNNEVQNSSDSGRSEAPDGALSDTAVGNPEEQRRMPRLLKSDCSSGSGSGSPQSGNLCVVNLTHIERYVHDESESSILHTRAVCDEEEQPLRSSVGDHILQYLHSANSHVKNDAKRDARLSESQSETSESSDESDEASDESGSEAEEDDEHYENPSASKSRGIVNKSERISPQSTDVEEDCSQKISDCEKEEKAEGTGGTPEESSEAEQIDAQCSDDEQSGSIGNSDNWGVLSDSGHSDTNCPRECVSRGDSDGACSADCDGDDDSSNMNSSSPLSAARGGSETESLASSTDDLETDSDELTLSEQSDDCDRRRGVVLHENGDHTDTNPSWHSSPDSRTHSGTNPEDELEPEGGREETQEEMENSDDTSHEEGSILGHVLSKIRSVLTTVHRRATGSSDEAMDRPTSEPNSGSEENAPENGSVTDHTGEFSSSSHTESSSANSSSQDEDGSDDEASSEPPIESPAGSDGPSEALHSEAPEPDVAISSSDLGERTTENGEAQDSENVNSSTSTDEDSDESVFEDSDHSSQVVSSSTMIDETDSDEMDLLYSSGSQYSP